ncbi:hypothetical protein CJJ09_003709 [Candidozyma auris]|nr:hypothetical protein CJJ09_003709 [[Candida] auris]
MAQVIWNADIDVYNPSVIPLSVAKTIAWFLDVPDLLSFSKISRNTYKAVNDPQLWIDKLDKMGVWQTGLLARREELVGSKFEWLDDPLTCLERIYKIPKIAKYQVLRIRRSLHIFYADLQENVPYEKLKLFKSFHTPQEQSKILSNLLKYNAMNPEETARSIVGEKITDLLEIFENALLRELEIHFDIQDYERTREFVEILVELKNEQTLIDFSPKIFIIKPTGDLLADSTKEDEDTPTQWILNEARLDVFIQDLANVFNDVSRVIDLIFPQTIPMMYKVSEELISNQLQDVILVLVSTSKERGTYFEMVTRLYVKLTEGFLQKLNPSENVGESYVRLTRSLLDVSYESIAAEYLNEEKAAFKQQCSEKLPSGEKPWSKGKGRLSRKSLST